MVFLNCCFDPGWRSPALAAPLLHQHARAQGGAKAQERGPFDSLTPARSVAMRPMASPYSFRAFPSRSNPWANVFHPFRLRPVLRSRATAEGGQGFGGQAGVFNWRPAERDGVSTPPFYRRYPCLPLPALACLCLPLPAVAKGLPAIILSSETRDLHPPQYCYGGRVVSYNHKYVKEHGVGHGLRGYTRPRQSFFAKATQDRGYGRQARYSKPSAWLHPPSARQASGAFYHRAGKNVSSSLPQSNELVTNAELNPQLIRE
jgi:hypothetical protein